LNITSDTSIKVTICFIVHNTLSTCTNFSLSTIPYGFAQNPSNADGTYCWLFPASKGRISYNIQYSNIFYFGDSFSPSSFSGTNQISEPFKGNWLFVSTKYYKQPSNYFRFNITGVSTFNSYIKPVDLSVVNDFIAFLPQEEISTSLTSTRRYTTYDYSGYIVGVTVGLLFITLGSLLVFVIGALVFKKYYKQCTGQTQNNRNINKQPTKYSIEKKYKTK